MVIFNIINIANIVMRCAARDVSTLVLEINPARYREHYIQAGVFVMLGGGNHLIGASLMRVKLCGSGTFGPGA